MFVGDGCYYGTIHIAVAARKYFSRMFVVTAVNWCTWVNVEQHLFLSFSFFVRVLDGVFFFGWRGRSGVLLQQRFRKGSVFSAVKIGNSHSVEIMREMVKSGGMPPPFSVKPGGARRCTYAMQGRSRMTIDPRIPTMPGRITSGFHQPGRHWGPGKENTSAGGARACPNLS